MVLLIGSLWILLFLLCICIRFFLRFSYLRLRLISFERCSLEE